MGYLIKKGMLKVCVKKGKSWCYTIIINAPFSLFIYPFIEFREIFVAQLKGKFKTEIVEDSIVQFTPIILFHSYLWIKFPIFGLTDSILMKYQLINF